MTRRRRLENPMTLRLTPTQHAALMERAAKDDSSISDVARRALSLGLGIMTENDIRLSAIRESLNTEAMLRQIGR